MKRYLAASFVLLLVAASSALYAQSSVGSSQDLGGSFQNSVDGQSGNCADTASSWDDGCAQSEFSTPRGNGGINSPGSYGSTRTNSSGALGDRTTSSQAEDATLRGRNRNTPFVSDRPSRPDPPTEFQKYIAEITGQRLPIYGANLFRNVPSTFSPNELSPVTSNYIVGPEDELRVRIWGQITYSGNLRVDRSGDVYLPQAGTVHVAGLQFSELEQHLRAAISRMYRNFDLSVDIGQIRSMQVYVAGQARRPGAYTVSSLSSLVDALFASGGPSPQGSLRHIELKRDGKTITDFDLYALLLHGDKSKDVKLLPEDVLYIPAAGPQVAITGSIRNPGIYELRDRETIGDLVEAAGKTTAMSAKTRISLERVGQEKLRQAMEFSFDAAGQAAPLEDGDIVRIYAIVPAYQNTVTLRGDVANPGRYSLKPGMHLSDIIPDRESLVSRDYWWKRSHLGLPVAEFEPAITRLSGEQPIPGFNGQPYAGGDSQQERSAFNLRRGDQQSSTVGTSRADQQSGSSSLASQMAYSSDSGDLNEDSSVPAMPRDTNADSSLPRGINTDSSMSESSNRPPSQSSGISSKPVRNEVRLAAPEIDWDYAVIERLDPETLRTSLIPFDLGKLVLNHDSSQDLALQAGDTVTIFSQADIRVPIEHQTKYVDLEGEIVHGGIYSVQPGETLRDLVRRAGGFTQNGYLYGSEFTRQSTRVLQQQRIDEYVKSVELDAEHGTQALAMSGTSSAVDAASASSARLAEQGLMARLRQIRATGRIVLHFSPTSSSLDDIPAISLENGDKFVLPSMPATINVVGAVYDQNSFVYESRQSAGRYLQLAGGPTRNADWRRSFIIHADGSVVSRDAVKGVWGNEFNSLRLNPGDTIVVPDKTLQPSGVRKFMDWTQMFSQLAIGAAVLTLF